MAYFAKNDPIWVDDHFAEDWEVKHLDSLPKELSKILIEETKANNRVNSAGNGYPFASSNIWFSKPIQVTKRKSHGNIEFRRSETPYDRYEYLAHTNSEKALLFPLK